MEAGKKRLAGDKLELTYECLKEYQVYMSEQKSEKQRVKDEREARIAKALRDNLRRRKSAQKQMKQKSKN